MCHHRLGRSRRRRRSGRRGCPSHDELCHIRPRHFPRGVIGFDGHPEFLHLNTSSTSRGGSLPSRSIFGIPFAGIAGPVNMYLGMEIENATQQSSLSTVILEPSWIPESRLDWLVRTPHCEGPSWFQSRGWDEFLERSATVMQKGTEGRREDEMGSAGGAKNRASISAVPSTSTALDEHYRQPQSPAVQQNYNLTYRVGCRAS